MLFQDLLSNRACIHQSHLVLVLVATKYLFSVGLRALHFRTQENTKLMTASKWPCITIKLRHYRKKMFWATQMANGKLHQIFNRGIPKSQRVASTHFGRQQWGGEMLRAAKGGPVLRQSGMPSPSPRMRGSGSEASWFMGVLLVSMRHKIALDHSFRFITTSYKMFLKKTLVSHSHLIKL